MMSGRLVAFALVAAGAPGSVRPSSSALKADDACAGGGLEPKQIFSLWDLVEVEPNAEEAEIMAARPAAVMRAARQGTLKEVAGAYTVLGDAGRRELYVRVAMHRWLADRSIGGPDWFIPVPAPRLPARALLQDVLPRTRLRCASTVFCAVHLRCPSQRMRIHSTRKLTAAPARCLAGGAGRP